MKTGMQVVLMVVLMVGMMTLSLNAVAATPETEPKVGRYTVVGMLAKGKDMVTRLLLNPPSATRISMPIQNPQSVKDFISKRGHSGLVRVELEVLPSVAEERAPVKILKITPVRARRVPVYNEGLMAASRGNG